MIFSASPEILSSKNKTTMAVEIKRSIGSSLAMVDFLMRIGFIRAAMPIRRRMFKILLPITLPISISVLPAIKDEMETASSGAPVPIATMVRPISCLETLKFEAMLEAPETSQSAPLMRKTKPTIKTTIRTSGFSFKFSACNIVSIFLF